MDSGSCAAYLTMVDPFLVEALQNPRHRLTSKFFFGINFGVIWLGFDYGGFGALLNLGLFFVFWWFGVVLNVGNFGGLLVDLNLMIFNWASWCVIDACISNLIGFYKLNLVLDELNIVLMEIEILGVCVSNLIGL